MTMPAPYQHGWTKPDLLNLYPDGVIFPDGWVYCEAEHCWFWPLPCTRIWKVFVSFETEGHDLTYERWATQLVFDDQEKLGFSTLPPADEEGEELQLFPQAGQWPFDLLKPDPPFPFLFN